MGKSTLVRTVLAQLDCRAGGVLAREIRRDGEWVGFELLGLLTGEVGTLASIDGVGPRLGRYRVNLRDLEEVGPMELFSERFAKAVAKALESDKQMLVVVQAKSQHPLVKRIRRDFRLIVVTEKNRDDLAEKIVSEFVYLM